MPPYGPHARPLAHAAALINLATALLMADSDSSERTGALDAPLSSPPPAAAPATGIGGGSGYGEGGRRRGGRCESSQTRRVSVVVLRTTTLSQAHLCDSEALILL